MTEPRRSPRRIFLSHTAELRTMPTGRSFVDAAESAVSRAGDVVADMAYFVSTDQPPTDVCRHAVLSSDVVVLIAGFRYGSPVRDRPDQSYMEFEFAIATEAGIPRLVFLLSEYTDGPAGLFLDQQYGYRQHAFRERLLAEDVVATQISSPAELETGLLHSLLQMERSESRGGAASSYTVTVHESQGIQVGDRNTQTNHFGPR